MLHITEREVSYVLVIENMFTYTARLHFALSFFSCMASSSLSPPKIFPDQND